jgi:plastocyanin
MPTSRTKSPPSRRAARVAGLVAIVVAGLLGLSFASSVAAADHDVAITADGFDPPSLTVVAGDAVTWTNETSADHAIRSDDGTLDSGPIGPGEAYGHVFDAPGTFRYADPSDPGFAGTIVVEAAPATSPPSGSLPPTPPPGTLPPDFSPNPVPSIEPTATTPAATAPSPAPSGGSTESTGASSLPILLIAALVIGVGVIGAYVVTARRTDR